MREMLQSQQALSSNMAKIDPRCKLIALLVCSVCILCMDEWIGLGICALFLGVGMVMGRIRPQTIMVLSIPLFIILLIIWLCNAFVYNPDAAQTGGFPIQVSSSGALQGLLYVVRIWFLFIATFLLVLTTAYETLLVTFTSLLSPLQAVKFPVDDAAMIATLALRFIPQVAQQAELIKRAQQARAAHFNAGSVWKKVMAWIQVFIPLFVMLFRQADRMSVAMEARCYGASAKRSSLNELTVTGLQVFGTVTLCLVFVVLAVWF